MTQENFCVLWNMFIFCWTQPLDIYIYFNHAFNGLFIYLFSVGYLSLQFFASSVLAVCSVSGRSKLNLSLCSQVCRFLFVDFHYVFQFFVVRGFELERLKNELRVYSPVGETVRYTSNNKTQSLTQLTHEKETKCY